MCIVCCAPVSAVGGVSRRASACEQSLLAGLARVISRRESLWSGRQEKCCKVEVEENINSRNLTSSRFCRQEHPTSSLLPP